MLWQLLNIRKGTGHLFVLLAKNITAIELLNTPKEHPLQYKIILNIVPPYSPNLNHIERVWKIMNKGHL